MKIVGITGRAGSGKSTVAGIIERLFPGSRSFSLADPIKEFAEAVFNFPHVWAQGPSELRSMALPQGPAYWRETHDRFWSLGGSFLREWEAAIGGRVPGSGSEFVDWFDRIRRECETNPSKLTVRHVAQQLGTEFGRAKLHEDVWVKLTLARTNAANVPVAIIPDVRFDNEAQAVRNTGGQVLKIERPGLVAGTHASEQGIDPRWVSMTIPNEAGIEELNKEVAEAFNIIGWIGD